MIDPESIDKEPGQYEPGNRTNNRKTFAERLDTPQGRTYVYKEALRINKSKMTDDQLRKIGVSEEDINALWSPTPTGSDKVGKHGWEPYWIDAHGNRTTEQPMLSGEARERYIGVYVEPDISPTIDEKKDAANFIRKRMVDKINQQQKSADSDGLVDYYDNGISISADGHNSIIDKIGSQMGGQNKAQMIDILDIFQAMPSTINPGKEIPSFADAELAEQLGGPSLLEETVNKLYPYPRISDEDKEKVIEVFAEQATLDAKDKRREYLIKEYKKRTKEGRIDIVSELMNDHGFLVEDFDWYDINIQDIAHVFSPEDERSDILSAVPEPSRVFEASENDIERIESEIEGVIGSDLATEDKEDLLEDLLEEKNIIDERIARSIEFQERMKDPDFARMFMMSDEQRAGFMRQINRKENLLRLQMQDPFAGITRQDVLRGTLSLFNETHNTEYSSIQQLMSDFMGNRLTGEQENDVIRWNKQGNSFIDKSVNNSSQTSKIEAFLGETNKMYLGNPHLPSKVLPTSLLSGDPTAWAAMNFEHPVTERVIQDIGMHHTTWYEGQVTLFQEMVKQGQLPIEEAGARIQSIPSLDNILERLSSGSYVSMSDSYTEKWIGDYLGKQAIIMRSGGEYPPIYLQKTRSALEIMERAARGEPVEELGGALAFFEGMMLGSGKQGSSALVDDLIKSAQGAEELTEVLTITLALAKEQWGPDYNQAGAESLHSMMVIGNKMLYNSLNTISMLSKDTLADTLNTDVAAKIEKIHKTLSVATPIGDARTAINGVKRGDPEYIKYTDILKTSSMDEFLDVVDMLGLVDYPDVNASDDEKAEHISLLMGSFFKLHEEEDTTTSWIPKEYEGQQRLAYMLQILGADSTMSDAFTGALIIASSNPYMDLSSVMNMTNYHMHNNGVTFVPGRYNEKGEMSQPEAVPYTDTFSGEMWLHGTPTHSSGSETYYAWNNSLPEVIEKRGDKATSILERSFPFGGAFIGKSMNKKAIQGLIASVVSEMSNEDTLMDLHIAVVKRLQKEDKGVPLIVEGWANFFTNQSELGGASQGLGFEFVHDVNPVRPSFTKGYRGNPRLSIFVTAKEQDDAGGFFTKGTSRDTQGRSYALVDWIFEDSDMHNTTIKKRSKGSVKTYMDHTPRRMFLRH